MTSPRVEPAFYPLPDLARAWNCSIELLEVYASGSGQERLAIESFDVGSKKMRGVSRPERARFESLGRAAKKDYGKQREETHLFLIGVMSMLWPLGELTKPDSHYQARDLILRDFISRFGGGPLRSRETDALAIKEGIALVQKHLLDWRASEIGEGEQEAEPNVAIAATPAESGRKAIGAARNADVPTR
jgi:hypothetical protein